MSLVCLGGNDIRIIWLQSRGTWYGANAPPVLGYGGLPQSGGSMSQVLDCTLINKVSLGPEWYGLQIGRSTFEDVVHILVPEYIYWDSYYGNLVFDEIPHKITTWWLPVNTCFLGNTLGAIQFYPDDKEYPKYLEDFVDTLVG